MPFHEVVLRRNALVCQCVRALAPWQRQEDCALALGGAVLRNVRSRRDPCGHAMSVPRAHTRAMRKDLRPEQRTLLVACGLIGVVLALTWLLLYLNAGDTSAF